MRKLENIHRGPGIYGFCFYISAIVFLFEMIWQIRNTTSYFAFQYLLHQNKHIIFIVHGIRQILGHIVSLLIHMWMRYWLITAEIWFSFFFKFWSKFESMQDHNEAILLPNLFNINGQFQWRIRIFTWWNQYMLSILNS